MWLGSLPGPESTGRASCCGRSGPWRRPDGSPGSQGPGRPRTGLTRRHHPSEEAHIGRGKTYYHFAYSYSRQMHRKNAGVSEVLEKLSVGFDKYIRILSHMRGEYLDLIKRLSNGEVYHLERSINEHSRQELLRVKQDELLELYSAWKRQPSAEAEEDLERIVRAIVHESQLDFVQETRLPGFEERRYGGRPGRRLHFYQHCLGEVVR